MVDVADGTLVDQCQWLFSAIEEIYGLHTNVYVRFVALEGSSVASARSNVLSCAFGTESVLDWVYTGSTGNCSSGSAEKGLRKYRHGEMNEQETKERRGEMQEEEAMVEVIPSYEAKKDVKLPKLL